MPMHSKTDSYLRPFRGAPALSCALAFAIGATVAAPAWSGQSASLAAPAQVQAAYPKRGTIASTIVLPGEVAPYQSVTLYAKVSGYLKTINVDKGDRVRSGSIIADIEVPELIADRAQFKAQVDVARSDYQRMQDAVKTAPDLVTAQSVDEARGRLEVAQAQLDRTETLLGYARIVAPFAGTVTARYVDPGAFIPAATSGAQQNAAVVSLMNFRRVRVQIPVPESEAPKINKGAQAVISASSLPGKEFQGSVTRISYALDPAARTMLAEIELDNPDEALRPGMYVSAQLTETTPGESLLVPSRALITEGQDAFVIRALNGRAVKTEVSIGNRNETDVEVTSGLTAGDAIILTPGLLADGAPVTVRP